MVSFLSKIDTSELRKKVFVLFVTINECVVQTFLVNVAKTSQLNNYIVSDYFRSKLLFKDRSSFPCLLTRVQHVFNSKEK